ncbi:myozenin-3 isoform X1 [Antennarius striatus]|uniref:myozenin-3 isoform X1 n=1 Tax=Antennarius striatus TaxID=241820 RepID=UPI0035B391F7
MTMVMQPGQDNITQQRMLQAKVMPKKARGGLNLGKKISVPKDVMMEELNLPSNRGSRMFQERQKRAEMFTLENISSGAQNTGYVQPEAAPPPPQIIPEPQRGTEGPAFSVPGKHSLVINLQKTIAKMGCPEILAPGYSGPLKIVPYERFNTTVIPKSYCSPWTDALGVNKEAQISINIQPLQLPQTQPYRCFNRSAVPFGGPMASERVIPEVSYEAVDSRMPPGITEVHMYRRPNFNRAPRGWGINRCPESNEL